MQTRMIPQEALPHFENAIYLPMLLQLLSRDKEIIEKSPIKLKQPYLDMIDRAIDNVQKDSKTTSDYLRNNKMKLIKGKTDETFTEFTFLHRGYEDTRRYLNVRLKNQSQELLALYLAKNALELPKDTELPFD
ncbi:hypothetical protein ABE073_04630 [Lederbergia citrisecunda]|uniref:hypothetical protein n=1 Tax=Lederbergia citrisecunda TaxID=2833583 RepID=UPI003D2ADD49